MFMKKLLLLLFMIAAIPLARAEKIDKSEIFEPLNNDCIDCMVKKESQEKISTLNEDIVKGILAYYDAYFFVQDILRTPAQLPSININGLQLPNSSDYKIEKLEMPVWKEDPSLKEDYRLKFNPTYYDFSRN